MQEADELLFSRWQSMCPCAPNPQAQFVNGTRIMVPGRCSRKWDGQELTSNYTWQEFDCMNGDMRRVRFFQGGVRAGFVARMHELSHDFPWVLIEM